MERRKNTLKMIASCSITILHAVLWAFVWIYYYRPLLDRMWYWKGNLLIALVYLILVAVFTGFYGGYRIGYYRPADVALSGIIAICFANFFTWIQTCLIAAAILNVMPLIAMTLVQAILLSVWALQIGKLYAKLVPPRQMLLVYGGTKAAKNLISKMITRSEKYEIQEGISIEQGLEAIQKKIKGFHCVVLCDVPAKARNHLLKFCFSNDIRTYTTPKISDILIRGATYINLFDSPLLLNRNNGISFGQRPLKRGLDLLISGIGLVVLFPIMLVVAVCIKGCDQGPVFYRQTRLTVGGREFEVIKFRSMRVDAEQGKGPQLATLQDDRITPVGRVIRKFRLDELPQFWNILRGDMSLVGPRPERPEIADKYLKEMPEFQYRLKVKAGLTGFAQVVGRYNTTPYDKLKMDLMYISNYSLVDDFKILLQTIKILFSKESAQGDLESES